MGGGHLGGVDDFGAEGNHQGGGGALAVALVAGGEVFAHAFGGAALVALVEGGVEIEFEIGLGENVRADVAAFHDEVAEFGAFALFCLHPFADVRDGGDLGGRRR